MKSRRVRIKHTSEIESATILIIYSTKIRNFYGLFGKKVMGSGITSFFFQNGAKNPDFGRIWQNGRTPKIMLIPHSHCAYTVLTLHLDMLKLQYEHERSYRAHTVLKNVALISHSYALILRS